MVIPSPGSRQACRIMSGSPFDKLRVERASGEPHAPDLLSWVLDPDF